MTTHDNGADDYEGEKMSTRLAIRPFTGSDGRHYLSIRCEKNGKPFSVTVECEHDPGEVKFFCGGGLPGLELVERDWLAA